MRQAMRYALCGTLGMLLACEAQADDSLDTIKARYQQNQQRLTELLFEWSSEPKLRKAAPQGTVVRVRGKTAVKGEMQFFETHLVHVSGPKLSPDASYRAMYYNGQKTYLALRPKAIRIMEGDEKGNFFREGDIVLALQGYPKSNHPIWGGDDISPERAVNCNLAEQIGKGVYRARAGGTKRVGEVECLEIVSSLDRVCLDPSCGLAVLQRELFDKDGQSVAARYTFDDFIEVLPELWLARQITLEQFAGGDQTLRLVWTVERIQASDVPDSVFTPTLAADTWVEDMSHFAKQPDGTLPVLTYTTPARPEELDDVVADALSEMEPFQVAVDKDPRSLTWRKALIAVNVLVLIVLLWMLLLRTRRARSA